MASKVKGQMDVLKNLAAKGTKNASNVGGVLKKGKLKVYRGRKPFAFPKSQNVGGKARRAAANTDFSRISKSILSNKDASLWDKIQVYHTSAKREIGKEGYGKFINRAVQFGAIGGAAAGAIEWSQGGSFWEGAKSGAVTGAAVGGGYQYIKSARSGIIGPSKPVEGLRRLKINSKEAREIRIRQR